jgi:hypothetical protein
MDWQDSPDDLSLLDHMHRFNDRMSQRLADLQSRCEQIISETDNANQRDWAIQELARLKRMQNRIPKHP